MSYNNLRKGRFSQAGREYLITCVTHRRIPWFTRFSLARCLINVFRILEEEQAALWLTWVVMPDHFHALIQLQNKPLSEVVQSIKGRSARNINRLLGRQGKLWQPGFYDYALRKKEDRLQIARYIVANPLRAGLVRSVGEYPHWDSIWLGK